MSILTGALPVEHLREGRGDSIEDGLCLMQVVAYLSGEGITDIPSCVDPSLGEEGIWLNDYAPDQEARDRLLSLARKLIGTASDGVDYSDELVSIGDEYGEKMDPVWMWYTGQRAPILSEYGARIKCLEDEYIARLEPMMAECDAKRALALAELNAKRGPIQEEHDKKVAIIRSKRKVKLAPIDAEYTAKRASIWEERRKSFAALIDHRNGE